MQYTTSGMAREADLYSIRIVDALHILPNFLFKLRVRNLVRYVDHFPLNFAVLPYKLSNLRPS